MGIREVAARALLGPKVRQMDYMIGQLTELYLRRPSIGSPEELRIELAELDSRYVDLLIRQIESRAQFDYTDEQIRLEIVRECREAFVFDVISQNIVDLWTNYGFGQNVEIIPTDENAIELWNEFWSATRNVSILGTRHIQVLSQEVLTAGELFFVFFTNKLTGKVTLRYLESEDITKIITHPDDKKVNLFYERNFIDSEHQTRIVWYPDWQASEKELGAVPVPEGTVRADTLRSIQFDDQDDITPVEGGTDVHMMHVAHRRKGKSKRGFPLMTAGIAWSRAYRDFLEDRASIARMVATYVDSLTIKGGSRAVDNIVRNLQSSYITSPGSGYETNPPPVAGSTWVQNEQMKRDRMPLTTGAGDAEIDGAAMVGQAGLSGTIFPHYLGRGEAFRLATATAMEGPTLRAFNGYQLWWSSVWSDIVRYVEMQDEKVSNKDYETHGATVTLDPVIQLDIEHITSVGSLLSDAFDRGLLEAETAILAVKQLLTVALQSIGINAAQTVFPQEKQDD